MSKRRLTWWQGMNRTLEHWKDIRTITHTLSPYLKRDPRTGRGPFELQAPIPDYQERIRRAIPWIQDPSIIAISATDTFVINGNRELRHELYYETEIGSVAPPALRTWILERVNDLLHRRTGSYRLPAPHSYRENTMEALYLLAESAVLGEPSPALQELVALASLGNEVLFLNRQTRCVYVRCGDVATQTVAHPVASSPSHRPRTIIQPARS